MRHARPRCWLSTGQGKAVDKVVDKYLRKKVGLTNPSATYNDNHFHLTIASCDPTVLPIGSDDHKVIESSTTLPASNCRQMESTHPDKM